MTVRAGVRRFFDTRGQSLIEFSLVAVMLVMLILGVVEICRMILVYTTVANGARIGVRYAIVHGSDTSLSTSQMQTEVQTVVNGYLSVGTVNTTNNPVTVTYPDPVGAFSSGCTTPGCHVTVTVSYPYDPFTSYFPLSVNLGSTSQGVITF